MANTSNPPPDTFPTDLGGNRAEYERLLCEEARAALIKYPKASEPKQEKPLPDT